MAAFQEHRTNQPLPLPIDHRYAADTQTTHIQVAVPAVKNIETVGSVVQEHIHMQSTTAPKSIAVGDTNVCTTQAMPVIQQVP